MRGLGDELDLDEVQQVYLPLSRLLSLYVEAAGELHRATEHFLHQRQPPRTPVRDRTGRLGRGRQVHDRPRAAADARPLARAPAGLAGDHRRLPAPNAELSRRGILHRKGFPESYDRKALLRVRHRHQVRQGRGRGPDVLPPHLRRRARTRRWSSAGPTSSSSRGSTCCSRRASVTDGRTGLAVSDFFDFSVYVDAATNDIRRWYTDRFLRLRETAFRDPASYFARYASLSHDEAVAEAEPDLGRDQRPQPRAERQADPLARHPGAAQGPRPLGPLRAAPQAVSHRRRGGPTGTATTTARFW